MRLRALLACSLTAAALAAPAFAESAAVGTWAVKAEVPQMGTIESTWTIAAAGGAYTIDIQEPPPAGAPGPMPEMKVSDFVVTGDSFTFKRTASTPQGDFALSYSGKVEGDALTADISFPAAPGGPAMPPMQITGTRK